MTKLNLPEYKLNIRKRDGKFEVFDILRNKYVALTPEEFVRQNFIHFLINKKNFPKSLLCAEISMQINNTEKRADIVLYDSNGAAKLIVECKAESVRVNQKVFDQIAAYNMKLRAKYLIVTNGINHYCCSFDHENNTFEYLAEIPSYEQIK